MPAKPHTKAGVAYLESLTNWLRDTRLMSEAIYRLFKDYERDGKIDFAEASWPKGKKTDLQIRRFTINPIELGQRMQDLLKALWSTRFVFLETLWEEYLEELVKELRHSDASIFEPFCEKEFMADVVRDVLTNRLDTVQDIKDEVAARFATGITRKPWEQQWKQLARLSVGLSRADHELPWFRKLDEYFEMRNCIIHRQGGVSPLLKQKSEWFRASDREMVEIWPPQLDFYRHQFIDCLLHMEGKIEAKLSSKA